MKGKIGIGVVVLTVTALLGFLSYRALDRYTYEHGININLKLYFVVAGLLIAGAALVALAWPRRRRS